MGTQKCMNPQMPACMMHAHTWTHSHTDAHTQIHTHTHTDTQTHTHTHTTTHTHISTQIANNTHANFHGSIKLCNIHIHEFSA